MDSVSILRVFWRNKWLFACVCIGIFALGSVYIGYKSRTNTIPINPQTQENNGEKGNYAFFISSKVISKAPNLSMPYFVNNKAINPVVNRLFVAKLDTDPGLADIIQNKLWLSQPNNYSLTYADFYYFIYPAENQKQALKIADFIFQYIGTAPEVQAFRENLSYLSTFKPEDSATRAWLASITDVLENGFLFRSSPALTNTKGFKDLSVSKEEALAQRFTPRFMWILLLVSSFVFASLAVFVREFLRQSWGQITGNNNQTKSTKP